VTFKFLEQLKNASEVTFVPKNIFFLKILNLVQSFVECKVSLADGTCCCQKELPKDCKAISKSIHKVGS
jgi:hypothetical protein